MFSFGDQKEMMIPDGSKSLSPVPFDTLTIQVPLGEKALGVENFMAHSFSQLFYYNMAKFIISLILKVYIFFFIKFVSNSLFWFSYNFILNKHENHIAIIILNIYISTLF